MNDKQIAALFMAQLLPRMQADASLAGVTLARNFQPRQQGAATGPVVYFFKIGDKRYGWAQRKDVADPPAPDITLTHTDAQLYESTYQLSAWVPQDPSAVNALTESDVLNIVSGIMQSDAIIAAFRASGVSLLRVTDVRNPYIVDDRDRFEAVPSFDIVLLHHRETVSTIPAVVTYEANINRV